MAVLEELGEIAFSMTLGYVGVFGILCAVQYIYHAFNMTEAEVEDVEEESNDELQEKTAEESAAAKKGAIEEKTTNIEPQSIPETISEKDKHDDIENVEDLQKDLWQLEQKREHNEISKELAEMEKTKPASGLELQENVENIQKDLEQLEQKQENHETLNDENTDPESSIDFQENVEDLQDDLWQLEQKREYDEISKEFTKMEKTEPESAEDLQKDLWQLEQKRENIVASQEFIELEKTNTDNLLDLQENVEDVQKDLWQREQEQENIEGLRELADADAKAELLRIEESQTKNDVVQEFDFNLNNSGAFLQEEAISEAKSRKKRSIAVEHEFNEKFANIMEAEVQEEILLPLNQENLMLEEDHNSRFILTEQYNSMNERAEGQSINNANDLMMQSESFSISPLRRSPHIDDMNKYAEEENFSTSPMTNYELLSEENEEKIINVFDYDGALESSTSFSAKDNLLDDSTSITLSVEEYKNPNKTMKKETWRDEYGLVVEGLSDFYDFQASANPSRSRNASPFKSLPESPEVMPNISISADNETPAVLSTDEINEMKDFVKSRRAERCRADSSLNENSLRVDTQYSDNKRSRSRSPLPTPDNLQKGLEKRRNKLIEQNNTIFEKLGVQVVEPSAEKGSLSPNVEQGECDVKVLSSAVPLMPEFESNYDDEQQDNSFDDDNIDFEELLNESSDDDHIDAFDMIHKYEYFESDYDDEELDDSEDEKQSVVEVENWEHKNKEMNVNLVTENNFYDLTSLTENVIKAETLECSNNELEELTTVEEDFENNIEYLNGDNVESEDEQLFDLETVLSDESKNDILNNIIDIAADDIDLNYMPKREYNWRKNFRLDDEMPNVSCSKDEHILTTAIENDESNTNTKILEEEGSAENEEENYVNPELVKQDITENYKNVDSILNSLVSNECIKEIYDKEEQSSEMQNAGNDLEVHAEDNMIINVDNHDFKVEDESFDDNFSNLREMDNIVDDVKEYYHDKDVNNKIDSSFNIQNIINNEDEANHKSDNSHFNNHSQVLSGLSDFYDFLRIKSTAVSDDSFAKEVEIEIVQMEANIVEEKNVTNEIMEQIDEEDDNHKADAASKSANVFDNFDILKDANLYPLF